ncbi:MAG: Ig-like domain-containing protein, partial [Sulfurimonas sp.]|nr:Ig-like domain-containing protein [Sulfurimonas sp.]
NAADAANAAITAAENAADTLANNENPTSADIATANNAISAADAAIATAAEAAQSYADAAHAAGETPVDTTTVGSTETATTTVTQAVAAEVDSDKAVDDLLTSANNAADAANAAITAAENAADTLANNENPTSADIATANNAITAAETAIATAADAAATYSNAATNAGETPVETTAVGSTETATTTLTEAIAAEDASDAVIADMVADVAELTNAANDAAADAQSAADVASDATAVAEVNPTPDNLATAQAAQDAATEAATAATSAANILSAAVDSLNAAATAAGESVDTTAATNAVNAANNTAANATQAGQINDRISTVSDSDDTDNSINENVAEGTYTGVTLNAVDVDGDSVTYSVADGVPFSVNADGQIVTSGAIDFEANPSYTFDVMATSADGTSSTQSITINVADIDDTIVNTIADLSDTSESGLSSTDNITNDNTPTINGTTEAGATVVITTALGIVVGSGVADTDGNYSITTDTLGDGAQTLTITATDAAGNASSTTQDVTIDTASSDISALAITNIVDNAGDYSSVTMSGMGAEAGNTITIYDEDGTAVATAEVDANGVWSADISNLSATAINDNEFFSITETDSAGNVTAQTDSAQYWHGTYSNASTEESDDFVFMGSGDDRVGIDVDDTNDSVVIDGGAGDDTAVFSGNFADYMISTNADGNLVVTETNGDVNELRNIEKVEFADGVMNVADKTFVSDGVEAPELSISFGEAVAQIVQVVDTAAMAAQHITANSDGTYSQTTYTETAKLMKTETISVGKAENIRLDDAPDHGTVEVQEANGTWSKMVVGQEYDASVQVRFTPDSSASSATHDVKIGTFGEKEGTNKFTEKVDISDWGTAAKDGKSVTFIDGDLSVTTTVVQNGSEQKLGVYNKSGTSDGAGIGDTDNAGLSRGETMVVKIDGQDVNQVAFTLDGLGSYFDKKDSHATQVIITAFDKDGNVIDAQGGYRESGSFVDNYEFTTTVPVARFEITTEGSDGNFVVQNMTLSKTIVDEVKFTAIAQDGTELSVASELNIQQGTSTTDITGLLPVSDTAMTKEIKVVDVARMEAKGALLVDGVWAVVSGVESVEPPMRDELNGYDYTLDLSAAAADGEKLSVVTLDNLPEGATLSGAGVVGNTVDLSLADPSDPVILSSTKELSNTELNTLEASVTATNDKGESNTSFDSSDLDVSGDLGNDTYDVSEDNTIEAGEGNDTFVLGADDLESTMSLDGGEGLDTLVFEGDMNIDLGALESGVQNIEAIDLGQGEQNISLSLDDVLDITDVDNVLRIDGDAGDTINLDTLDTGGSGEWTLGEFKTDLETGQTYQEYTGGEGDDTVTLEISTNITIEES